MYIHTYIYIIYIYIYIYIYTNTHTYSQTITIVQKTEHRRHKWKLANCCYTQKGFKSVKVVI